MNPIINRITQAVEAKTQAAVDRLQGLRVEVEAALATAEAEARDRIARESQALTAEVEGLLAGFGERLSEISRDSFAGVVGVLMEKVERLGCGCCATSSQESDSPPAEVPAIASSGITEARLWQTEEEASTTWAAEVPGEVAAQEAARQGWEVVPSAALAAPAKEKPTTKPVQAREEYFERRGRGRKTTYVLVDLPLDGQTYFRRVGSDWEPVVFGEG